MKWTAKMRDGDISATSEELLAYRRAYVNDGDLSSRMSELLWFDIYVLDQHFGVGPHEIMMSINNVEAGEPPIGLKPSSQYKNPPLKGLWHKHYFSAQFIGKNLALAHGKTGVARAVEEVLDPLTYPTITREAISELAHRVVTKALEKREQDGKLTGEWIIYANHDSKNYYLCLNTHDAGDEFIFHRIIEHCRKQFPFLQAMP